MSNTNFKRKKSRKNSTKMFFKKSPGIHLTKVVKDLCNENIKMTEKQGMEKLENGKLTRAHGLIRQCKN